MSIFPAKSMDPPPTSDEAELVLKYDFENLNLFAVQNQSMAEALWEYFSFPPYSTKFVKFACVLL